MKTFYRVTVSALLCLIIVSSCSNFSISNNPQVENNPAPLQVIAVESFLAEITQNIVGNRFRVGTLIPAGMDPHAFEPTPQDVVKISKAQVIVINGGGLETWIDSVIQNTGKNLIINASTGLTSRISNNEQHIETENEEGNHPLEGDPHFWLDPNNVIVYVKNIRDGLIQTDPQGEENYRTNAENYINKLIELDSWIKSQVEQIAPQDRKFITNHESFGYYADRYEFTIIGTVIPSTSSAASPSAAQLSALIEQIRSTGVKAILLESDANPTLAKQLAEETGIKVITGLYTHSVTDPAGNAPTYIEMIRQNTLMIVEALK